MPISQIITATLIPFQGVIIHDGVVISSGVAFGKKLSDHCKEVYKNAKREGRRTGCG